MPNPEDLARVAGEWVAKAEDDLTTAVHLLKLGRACPTDTVCFHVQQCVEKYLKASLVSKCVPFRKTHELEELVGLMPQEQRPGLSDDQLALLTEYAVGPRYPGWREVPLSEARQAVATARRVRKHVRSLLPKQALPPRKRP